MKRAPKLRLLSAFLALAMLLTLLPTAAFAEDTTDYTDPTTGIEYTLDPTTKTATVKSGRSATQTEVVIPEKVPCNNVEYKVTSIGEWAFYDCSALDSIEIPNSVTSIGNCAFYECSSLKSVTGLEGVTSIGTWAFDGCTSLVSINIPNSVTIIGDGAFYDCSALESITIANSVTSIGEWAFYDCSALDSIEIPNSVTSIGKAAFNSCTSLKSVNIPNSVTSIGERTFRDCTSLDNVYIPDSVTSIGEEAFAVCTGLTSIDIPSSVTSIGDGAFFNCTSLKSVEIPNSVTSIGKVAFAACTDLTSIDIPSSVTSIGDGAFNSCTCLKSVNIPNSVTSIGERTFRDCTSLDNVYIPDSVTSIGDGAFVGCTNLKSINIPNSVTSIGERTFRDCTSLDNVYIPDSVTSIGDGAFLGCTNLKSINIPNSVTNIGNGAFSECESLDDVKFNGSKAQWEKICDKNNGAIDDAILKNVKYRHDINFDPNGGKINGKEAAATKIIYSRGTIKLVDADCYNPEDMEHAEKFAAPTPTREGYTFDGWYIKDGNDKLSDTKFDFESAEITDETEDITLYAKWTQNSYTVTFVDDTHNTKTSEQTVLYGGKVEKPADPKTAGYTFAGWYLDKDCTDKYDFDQKVESSFTLYAKWSLNAAVLTPAQPILYTVTVENGTAYDGETAKNNFKKGDTVTVKVNEEALKEMDFDKWEVVKGDVKLADETAKETTFEMPAENVELKAVLKAKAPEEPAGEKDAAINPASVVVGAGVAVVGGAVLGYTGYLMARELFATAILPAGAALPTNKAELAALLWKQAEQPAVETATDFADIADADTQSAVQWAVANGLMSAEEDGTFAPEKSVSLMEVYQALKAEKAWQKANK